MNIVYFLIALNVLLLVLILRLSLTISKLPEQIRRLQLLIHKQRPNLAEIIGEEWISDISIFPAIQKVESKTIYFEDGVVAPEPTLRNNAFLVTFGTRKLWYENLQAATLSSYTIANTNKCSVQGLVDVL